MINRYLFPLNSNEHIHEWIEPDNGTRTVILFSHGNSETVGDVLPLMKQLSEYCRCAVLLYEYPMNATPESVNEAALKAYKSIVGYDSIVLMGRSIGTGPTLYLAQLVSHCGIILISPFTSIQCIIMDKLPGFLWFLSKVITEPYPNLERIMTLDTPLLIIHGKKDDVIPVDMAEQLYVCSKSSDRHLHVIPDGTHTNVFDIQAVYGFMINNKLV